MVKDLQGLRNISCRIGTDSKLLMNQDSLGENNGVQGVTSVRHASSRLYFTVNGKHVPSTCAL